LRRRALIALAALLLAGLGVAGCTRIATHTGVGKGNPWTTPGVLRIGIRQEPDNLNPLLSSQSIGLDIAMFWAGFLLDYDDRGRFVPDLSVALPTVENGGISKDGRTITYRLRPGVTWQDGAPFTADDLIFTWHAIMNPRNEVPNRVGFEEITSIAKVDDHTLAVHLRRPYAPFIADFFTPAGYNNFVILPSHLLARYPDINRVPFNVMPVGLGPYRVVHYEPDNLIRLAANPRYWRGVPGLREIDIHVVPNDNTLATLIRSHEIDLYYRVPHRIARTLSDVAGTTIVSAWFTRYTDIGFNTQSPILSDARVRRALAYATDKPALLQKVTYGGDLIADSDQPPALWAHSSSVPHYPYDPVRAAALLESAGWHLGPDGVREKNGTRLHLGLAGAAGDVVSMMTREVLQAQWRQVGVDAEIRSYPSSVLYAPSSAGGIERSGRFDAVMHSWANGADPDDSGLFECRWVAPVGDNVYRFCDPALDAAEATALGSNDVVVRKAAYARIQDILARQMPLLMLWFERYDYAVNSDLRNFRPSHVGSPFWNAWEWQI
jgi:peptide/nickel transport system substrate-binding protein